MTHPQNPNKKHRTMKKIAARLAARIKAWEAHGEHPNGSKSTYHKPGSRQKSK